MKKYLNVLMVSSLFGAFEGATYSQAKADTSSITIENEAAFPTNCSINLGTRSQLGLPIEEDKDKIFYTFLNFSIPSRKSKTIKIPLTGEDLKELKSTYQAEDISVKPAIESDEIEWKVYCTHESGDMPAQYRENLSNGMALTYGYQEGHMNGTLVVKE